MITEFQLDGELLGMDDLEWMRDRSSFRLNMVQLAALIHSRIELEQRPKPGDRFKVVPHNFQVGEWCSFDATNPTEMSAFNDLCRLALGPGFIAMYWMPKYLAQIDSSGQHVGSFVEQHLSDSPHIDGDALARLGYLASAYRDDSDAWVAIAHLICARVQAMRKEDREHVYFGLSRKETGVLQSLPGQVADYYIQRRDIALHLRDAESHDSPLRGYREWALSCAEADLRQKEQSAEEDANG